LNPAISNPAIAGLSCKNNPAIAGFLAKTYIESISGD